MKPMRFKIKLVIIGYVLGLLEQKSDICALELFRLVVFYFFLSIPYIFTCKNY